MEDIVRLSNLIDSPAPTACAEARVSVSAPRASSEYSTSLATRSMPATWRCAAGSDS